MLSKKGFAKDHRAISIQDQAQIRNLDSKKGMPRFDNFKIQFYSSILDTFSTASTRRRHQRCGPSEKRLVWITLKAEFHAAIVRIIGFGIQTDVHGCEVNVSPFPLDRVRRGETCSSTHTDDRVDGRNHQLRCPGKVADRAREELWRMP